MINANSTILFQGDSITDAFRRPEELNDAYRLGNGYAFIAGSVLRATLGTVGLSVQNRGVAGHTAAELLARWQRDCLELRPDLLSLLIGVNDAHRGMDGHLAALPGFAAAYDVMLEQVRSALPTCRLVLLEPFALIVDQQSQARLAQLKPIQAHVRAAAARHQATFVELQGAFEAVAGTHPEQWIYDGVHPTAAGHWLIAQRWLDVVAGIRLPAPVALP